MGKIVTVSSGKGGTGKTTTVAAVSSCLAALGFKTLCLDFDAGMRNLDLSLGMSEFSITDFMDVIETESSLEDAVQESPHINNLYYLGAPMDFYFEPPDEGGIQKMFGEIRDVFDYCLVDMPPGIGNLFTYTQKNTDIALFVVLGQLPSIKAAQTAAQEARKLGVKELRLLINRFRQKSMLDLETTVDEVIDAVGVQLLGVIEEDDIVPLALNEETPLILYKKLRSARNFLDAARRLIGEDIPSKVITVKYDFDD